MTRKLLQQTTAGIPSMKVVSPGVIGLASHQGVTCVGICLAQDVDLPKQAVGREFARKRVQNAQGKICLYRGQMVEVVGHDGMGRARINMPDGRTLQVPWGQLTIG